MLVEALIAISLFGIVLAAVSESHHAVSKLISSASLREDRERQFLREHFRDVSPSAKCIENSIIPKIVKETCCVLELPAGDNIKSAKSCRLQRDSGSGLIELLIAGLLVMLLAVLSYPTLRQLMIERKQMRKAHLQKLSVSELESEIERVLFDNQSLELPNITKVISQSDPIVQPVLKLTNQRFAPHPVSSILSTSSIDFTNLLLSSQKSVFQSSSSSFKACGNLPAEAKVVAGFFQSHWELLYVQKFASAQIPGCGKGIVITLNKVGSQTNDTLLGVAPVLESDLYYLDNSQTIRRYSLTQKKTTPVDYGYSRFAVTAKNNLFNFLVTKKDKAGTRDFNFNIELASSDENSFLSLLL